MPYRLLSRVWSVRRLYTGQDRDSLSFFVNRRVISSRLLTRAVEEAYQGLLMQGRHPIAIINISIPPSEVDVNIHPTKAEVKFQNERTIFTAVQKAVRSTLVATAPVPKIEEMAKPYTGKRLHKHSRYGQHLPKRPSFARSRSTQTPRLTLPVLRVIGQVASNYIVAEGPDGLYVIDQHAAHERILYEQLKEQKAQQGIQVQGMLEPVTFEVTPQQDEMLKSRPVAFIGIRVHDRTFRGADLSGAGNTRGIKRRQLAGGIAGDSG